MTDRELMQQALDALETITSKPEKMSYYCSFAVEIENLRARLAQPEPTKSATEPVAWQVIPEGVSAKPLTEMKAKHIIDRDGYVVGGYILDRGVDICLVHHSAVRWMKYDELFQILHVTAPPQREWQGLTDEEIIKLQHLIDWTAHWSTKKFAHAIEAKLKEKNG